MRVIDARNVCDALPRGIDLLLAEGRLETSRAGDVIVAPTPVTTVYDNPRERVLFSKRRNANPFFHLGEALWMLAGRRDVAFLNHFVRDFGDRFAEADGVVHDAYGYRWRHAFGLDQVRAVVRKLIEEPTTRQAVIQIWDARPTPNASCAAEQNDFFGSWKTRPCNTQVYFRLRDERRVSRFGPVGATPEWALDMTVTCRSNDIWWGCYGANVVSFSVLQEYVAAMVDAAVGRYYQVSNNFHLYRDIYDSAIANTPVSAFREDLYSTRTLYTPEPVTPEPVTPEPVTPEPLVDEPALFDEEAAGLLNACDQVMELVRAGDFTGLQKQVAGLTKVISAFGNTFLSQTAWPMFLANAHWRAKAHNEARGFVCSVRASDWREAARRWVEARSGGTNG